MNGRLGFNVRMRSDNRIKCLFDYQRFEREPRLAALIEEVERRYALNEAGAFTLSDESLGALAAAGAAVFAPLEADRQLEVWIEAAFCAAAAVALGFVMARIRRNIDR